MLSGIVRVLMFDRRHVRIKRGKKRRRLQNFDFVKYSFVGGVYCLREGDVLKRGFRSKVVATLRYRNVTYGK